ncbi:MAG: mechanosensitive ion channel family protein [Coriobacteriaceae bacterium]|nr:mechanosensitive ion channel family protein [Coriobacteriaceae bacterium]
MKQAKNIIGIIVSVILIVLLLNPQWLPVSAQTAETMGELKLEHFLIERSGAITTAHLLTLLLAVAVVWLVYTIIRLILAAVGRRSDHAATVTTLVAGSLKYLAVIVAFVWGLSILGVNTTAVLAGIGIIGLILGFGAQSLIEDIITGLFVIFERQYEIGDIIILDDFRGTVRSIGVRTTTIEDPGGNLKIVNNSEIRKLQNRSRANSIAACEVSVAYDTDIPRMEAILAEAFPKMYADHRDIYLAPPRYLGVDELGDSGIKLKIIVDCAESKVFAAKRQLNRDVRILFSETGIEIPFPQVVVHKG